MKKRVIVVDDDVSVRDSLKKLLEEMGCEVVLCADGQEGAEALAQHEIDLIVLDLDLPKLTGFDLLDLAAVGESSAPIIILTGMSDQCLPDALAGADSLIEKPPDVSLLLQTIEHLLDEAPTQRARRRCQLPHQARLSFLASHHFSGSPGLPDPALPGSSA